MKYIILGIIALVIVTVVSAKNPEDVTLQDISICMSKYSMEEISASLQHCDKEDNQCMVEGVMKKCGF